MAKETKNVSVMCFHNELCRVFNALMTALSLLRERSKVTIFFGSRGVNAVHNKKVNELKCMPDEPKEVSDAVMKRMEEMDLPTIEDLFVMLIAEGATVLACPPINWVGFWKLRVFGRLWYLWQSKKNKGSCLHY